MSETDPDIGIDDSPFYVNHQTRPWFAGNGTPRRAGVSAFGFGGSNFHVVLEEHLSGKKEVAWDGSVEMVALSHDTIEGLRSQMAEWQALADSPETHEHLPMRAAASRTAFSPTAFFRLVMVLARDHETNQWNLGTVLESAHGLVGEDIPFGSAGNAFFGSGSRPGKLAFAFPGQGSQYCGMGKDIVSWFPEAMTVLEHANGHFKGDGKLTDVIYPIAGDSKEAAAANEERLRNTAVAQPALGGVSMAMARVLERFGVTPEGACGHSYGELAALCAAGWIDEPTLHELSNLRGQLMAAAGGGTMAAVKAPLDQIEAVIASENLDVVLANRNTPSQGVLSGSVEAVEAAEKAFKANKLRAIRLQVSAAFHSELVETARAPFAEALKDYDFSPTGIPVYSNTTGDAYPTDPQAVRTLLGNHLRNAVNFVDEVTNLHQAGFRIFLEVGPRAVMKGLVGATLVGEDHHAIAMDASAGKQFGVEDLAKTLAHLAALGQGVHLTEWESGEDPPAPRKMSIPISGANLKSPGRGNASASSLSLGSQNPRKQGHDSPNRAASVSEGTSQVAAIPAPTAPTKVPAQEEPTGQNHPAVTMPQSQGCLPAALSAVEEGVRSIQAIHLQTAQAHEKFLETQAATAKAIQQLMARAAGIVGQLDPPLATEIPEDPPDRPRTQKNPAVMPSQQPETAIIPGITVDTEPMTEKVSTVHRTSTADRSDSNGVAPVLIDIVSDLTGYPKEMLSMDMDMETDLGIDSIKRVEILSTIEERLPGLAPGSPDAMAELRTLSQVASALANSGSVGSTADDAHPLDRANAPRPAASDADLADTLLSVVSDLTGYPQTMLNLDMDIEADLGIDSIKRVEILSAIEEKLPHLQGVSPEELVEMSTLGQIAARLSASSAADNRVPITPPPPSPPQTPPPASGDVGVETILSQVVSELTGYPVDMLNADMDMESDLGIDSIKRVEILSLMEERLPHITIDSPDTMASLCTLGQIARHLSALGGEAGAAIETNTQISPPESSFPPSALLGRATIHPVATPRVKGPTLHIPAGKRIFITTDRSGLSEALSEALSSRGLRTVLVSVDILKHRDPLPEAAGLVLIADLPEPGNAPVPNLNANFLKNAFSLIKAVGSDTARRSDHEVGDAFFASVSRLDGAFGFRGGPIEDPVQGGLAGLIKTAHLEWPKATCRAFDIDPGWTDSSAIAEALAGELLEPDAGGPVEIGLTPENRFTLAEEPGVYPQASKTPALLENGDVVVISGGAKGVTASAAKALADRQTLSLVLLGRSPAPVPEPHWLNGLEDEAAIKQAILANGFRDVPPKPIELDAAYRRYMGNREIASTLDAITKAGSECRYYSVDIRNAQKVAAIFKDIRAVHGPVRAIIHGAGVLEDRLILDKAPEQFESVVDTKILGLENLLKAVDPEALRHLVLFSSAAARYGNRGQSDYAAANEVLNKTAVCLQQRLPTCRVISVNWGPWDGGMVQGALRREFIRNGADLIPIDAGASALVHEMASTGPSPIEIVVGSGFSAMPPSESFSRSPSEVIQSRDAGIDAPDLNLKFQRDIDESSVPVLAHHKLDGKPVLPFALMAEWFAHSALHENPGLLLNGIDDMRLLKGVVVENGKKRIRLMAGKTRKNDDRYVVSVELRNGVKNHLDVVHSRATAVLSDQLPEPPGFSIPPGLEASGYNRSVKDIYQDILFHGDALQGIRKVRSLTSEGMIAEINTAPPPNRWMADPPRNRWISDPLVLDCAYQMAILWCYEQKGRVSLPSYNASYRQYRRVFPSEPVTAVLLVRSVSRHKMTADITFLDGNNQVVAAIAGHESIMDDFLIQAFKSEALTAAG
ncbi:MAG: SDR family NAD(P)-dependent oxidoreductase [Desulfobacterales bacterium]